MLVSLKAQRLSSIARSSPRTSSTELSWWRKDERHRRGKRHTDRERARVERNVEKDSKKLGSVYEHFAVCNVTLKEQLRGTDSQIQLQVLLQTITEVLFLPWKRVGKKKTSTISSIKDTDKNKMPQKLFAISAVLSGKYRPQQCFEGEGQKAKMSSPFNATQLDSLSAKTPKTVLRSSAQRSFSSLVFSVPILPHCEKSKDI